MINVAEFEKGNGSFEGVCKENGCRTFTLDWDKKFNPDLVKDILKLKREDIPFVPDIIWLSPPCTEYSKAKSQGKRNLKYADKIVKKNLEIIEWFPNALFILENPQTGLLKSRKFMKGISFEDASYCKYGFPYKKQTRFWNNVGLKLKTCNKDCNFMVKTEAGKRHIGSAGCGGKGQGHKIKYSDKSYKVTEKYAVPRELCLEILKQCLTKLNSEGKFFSSQP
jgi:hypothetical protein